MHNSSKVISVFPDWSDFTLWWSSIGEVLLPYRLLHLVTTSLQGEEAGPSLDGPHLRQDGDLSR